MCGRECGGVRETVRLTTAQAIVRWLAAQRIEIEGTEIQVFAGVHGIFGHRM